MYKPCHRGATSYVPLSRCLDPLQFSHDIVLSFLLPPLQRRSQDFCLGGGLPAVGRCHPVHFPSSPEADQIQWGGVAGVVAEIFRDLVGRTRFSGGGVVAEFFPVTAGVDQRFDTTCCVYFL